MVKRISAHKYEMDGLFLLSLDKTKKYRSYWIFTCIKDKLRHQRFIILLRKDTDKCHAIVTACHHLNDLIILYGCKNSTELQSLHRVQNKALKIIYNLPISYHKITLYKEVGKNILPVNGTYKLRLITFVLKAVTNIGHNTISFSKIKQPALRETVQI